MNTRAWGRRVVLELTHPEVAHGRAGETSPSHVSQNLANLGVFQLGGRKCREGGAL